VSRDKTHSWGEAADEAIAYNVADVMANGPRLSWDRKTAEIAIDRANKQVKKTGLGCMGVGEMWIGYDEELAEWADLPEGDSTPYPWWEDPMYGGGASQ